MSQTLRPNSLIGSTSWFCLYIRVTVTLRQTPSSQSRIDYTVTKTTTVR